MPSAIVIGDIGHVQRRAGVEQHDVARRAGLAGQHGQQHRLRCRRARRRADCGRRPSGCRSPPGAVRIRAPRRRAARRPSCRRRARSRPCRRGPTPPARVSRPGRCSTRAWMPTRSGWNTPIRMFGAPAGLVSGPRMLKMVRTPSSLAHRRDVLHRRVVDRREHEADAGGRRCSARPAPAAVRSPRPALPARRRCRTSTTRCGCRAWRPWRRPRRTTNIAVGGDVEGVRAVAAGADDIDEMRVVRHLDAGARTRASPARRRRSRRWFPS